MSHNSGWILHSWFEVDEHLIFLRIFVYDSMTVWPYGYTWSTIAKLLAPDLSSGLRTEESSERRESSTTEAAMEVFSLAVLNLFLELLKMKVMNSFLTCSFVFPIKKCQRRVMTEAFSLLIIRGQVSHSCVWDKFWAPSFVCLFSSSLSRNFIIHLSGADL